MVELKEVTSVNADDLYGICGPDKEPYISAKRESRAHFVEKIGRGWKGFVLYEGNEVLGRAELTPVEESLAAIEGKDIYFLPCVWVKPDAQKKGYGRKLMEGVINSAKDRKGLATNAIEEDWMPKGFFERFGFEAVGLAGTTILMLKKFSPSAEVRFIPSQFQPKDEPDKINIEVVYSLKCPYMIANYREAMKVAKNLSDKVKVTEYLIKEREDKLRCGFEDFYIDGENPFAGPIEIEKLEEIIKKKLNEKD